MADTVETSAPVEPIEHDSPDAQILVLRNEQTGELEAENATVEAKAKYRKGAADRKAIFEHLRTGADARAGRLPRLLTASWAIGATNLMLAKLLNEQLIPASAKEAADIAKITHGIYREASGQSAGNMNLTAAERAQRMGEIDKLEGALRERAKDATTSLGGAPGPDEVPDVDPALPAGDDDLWEHDDPVPSGPDD